MSLITIEEQQAVNSIFSRVIQDQGYAAYALSSMGLGDLLGSITPSTVIRWNFDQAWTDIYAQIVAAGGKATVYVYNDPNYPYDGVDNVDPSLHITAGAYDLTNVNFVGIARGIYAIAYITIDPGVTIDANGACSLIANDLEIDVNGPLCSPGSIVFIQLHDSFIVRLVDEILVPQAAEISVNCYEGSNILSIGGATTPVFEPADFNPDTNLGGVGSAFGRGGSSVGAGTYGGSSSVTWTVSYDADSASMATTSRLFVGGPTYSGNLLSSTAVALSQFTTTQLATGADANTVGWLRYDKTVGRPVYSNGSVHLAVGTITGSLANRPAATAAVRGMHYIVQAASGTADTMTVCMKSAGDTYSWVVIGTG